MAKQPGVTYNKIDSGFIDAIYLYIEKHNFPTIKSFLTAAACSTEEIRNFYATTRRLTGDFVTCASLRGPIYEKVTLQLNSPPGDIPKHGNAGRRGAKTPVTTYERRQIVALARGGKTMKEISATVGLKRHTVRRVLRETRRNIGGQKRVKIQTMWECGVSSTHIRQALKITQIELNNMLRELDQPARA